MSLCIASLVDIMLLFFAVLSMSLYCSALFFFFLMIRRPPRSTLDRSSAASDVYKRQPIGPGLSCLAGDRPAGILRDRRRDCAGG